MSSLQVTALRYEEYGEWQHFVAHSPAGSIYAQADYLDALCSVTGARFRIIGVRRDGVLIGGVALYETSSSFGRRHAGPRLLLYYHGPVLAPYEGSYPSQRTARDLELQEALLSHLQSLRFDSLVLKSRSSMSDVRPYLLRHWQATPSYTYVVPLDDLAAQWQRVENNLRRLVRRSETHGLSFCEDEDFDSFFRLHALTMSRRGLQTYLPERAFRRFIERLRALGLARLQHVRLHNGTVIASQLVLLGGHPVSHTACAGMDPQHSRLGASALLRWRGFEALAALGYRANDLTDAALNPVTHFKSQLGGQLEMSLVLIAPPSTRQQVCRAVQRTLQIGHSSASRVARLVRNRRRS